MVYWIQNGRYDSRYRNAHGANTQLECWGERRDLDGVWEGDNITHPEVAELIVQDSTIVRSVVIVSSWNQLC